MCLLPRPLVLLLCLFFCFGSWVAFPLELRSVHRLGLFKAKNARSPSVTPKATPLSTVPLSATTCRRAHHRTYYKFKGKAHSSEHLLRFLNMVCNQHDDKTWTLSNAATGVQSIGATQGGGISGIIQNRSDIALGLVGGAAVLLGVAGLAVRQRAVELQQ
eukprot:1054508-Pelagomonas_calceolata.AAC.4